MKKGIRVIIDGERIGVVTKGGAREVEVQIEGGDRETVPVSCCSTEMERPARADEVYPGQSFRMAAGGGSMKVTVEAGDLRHVNPNGYYVIVRDGLYGTTHRARLADLLVDVAAQIRSR